ncbi:MAG: hypothetical protein NVS3B28_10790 [Candidatus Velthaea sp.]
MQPEELTTLLNEYFTEMSAIALRHGGTVDKFVGDAILVFFGDPESLGVAEDTPRDSVCSRWIAQRRRRRRRRRERAYDGLDLYIDPVMLDPATAERARVVLQAAMLALEKRAASAGVATE